MTKTNAYELSPAVETLAISYLQLHNFRNYTALALHVGPGPVILTGSNGAGKTNILEAISFLSPGKGLRGAALLTMDRKEGGNHFPWSVAATITTPYGYRHMGTGRDPLASQGKRIVKIDREMVRGHALLSEICNVIWQTPLMDGIFVGPASERRKFLDRLVYTFDPSHAKRIAEYEHAMRERNRLLAVQGDTSWLGVVEHQMAASAIAIAVARNHTVEVLQSTFASGTTPFPKAHMYIEGDIEQWVHTMPALQVEEKYQQQLFATRGQDRYRGRTSLGPHKSDLVVTHTEKNALAALCSTGEQKALLLSILLAEARARVAWQQTAPILLLDEVVAHLDMVRREALFEELLALQLQVWMTGTDPHLFMPLKGKAQFFSVEAGRMVS